MPVLILLGQIGIIHELMNRLPMQLLTVLVAVQNTGTLPGVHLTHLLRTPEFSRPGFKQLQQFKFPPVLKIADSALR